VIALDWVKALTVKAAFQMCSVNGVCPSSVGLKSGGMGGGGGGRVVWENELSSHIFDGISNMKNRFMSLVVWTLKYHEIYQECEDSMMHLME